MTRTAARVAITMLAVLAAACSDATAGAEGTTAQAPRPAAAPPPGAAAEGPCALLTIAEVQRAFAGAKPAKLDRSLEHAGILRCA